MRLVPGGGGRAVKRHPERDSMGYPVHDHSHERANGNHQCNSKKLQGICQIADWVFATAQRRKSMFR